MRKIFLCNHYGTTVGCLGNGNQLPLRTCDANLRLVEQLCRNRHLHILDQLDVILRQSATSGNIIVKDIGIVKYAQIRQIRRYAAAECIDTLIGLDGIPRDSAAADRQGSGIMATVRIPSYVLAMVKAAAVGGPVIANGTARNGGLELFESPDL